MKRYIGPLKVILFLVVVAAGYFTLKHWNAGGEEPDEIIGDTLKNVSRGSHPTDAALESVFKAHRADFDKLIQISNENAKVIRITDSYTWLEDNSDWPRPQSEWGITQARWDEYKALFKTLGLEQGLDRSEDGMGSIRLVASSRGAENGGSDKGYAYSDQPLKPLADSLDGVKNAESNVPVFKKLADHWYLYYMEYE